MRLLLVGDFRSPLARGWVEALPPTVDEAVLLSTREAAPVADTRVVGFVSSSDPISAMKNSLAGKRQAAAAYAPHLISSQRRHLPRIAAEVAAARAVARHARRLLDSFEPDIVHGLRIPFEGIAAALAIRMRRTHLALSIWGNDLTLHASNSRWVGRLTRQALGQTVGLHVDCERDARLATDWGLPARVPILVAPTNGGLDERIFSPGAPTWERLAAKGLVPGRPIVVNPRGLRAYVRTDVFIRAIDLVRRDIPDVLGVAVGVAGHAPSRVLVEDLGLGSHLILLPAVSQELLADIFRASLVSVSPTTHDGTPNSLLEAMACGAFPVVSDLASTREWVKDGSNGFLFDPGDPAGLASRIVCALRQSGFRRAACEANSSIVLKTATRSSSTMRIASWYEAIVAGPDV